MENALRHGWMKIPNVQDGDRTFEEQVLAVRPAIAECAGKTVLDLGCAEGLIALEFAKAGAKHVHGIDSVHDHIEVARKVCEGYTVTFEEFNLKQGRAPLSFDIVLALGIIHKLRYPDDGLRFAARSARELLLLRSGRGSVNGIITSKHFRDNTVDSHVVLTEEVFVMEKVVSGPAHIAEDVEYWRRQL